MNIIKIIVPNSNNFYHLYSYGYGGVEKVLDQEQGFEFTYPINAIIILYYTYPQHRRAYLVRFTEDGQTSLPGVSLPVKTLIKVHASKVDKLKKAISFIKDHYGNTFTYDDQFYERLELIIKQPGKINYESIRTLCNLQGSRKWK